MVGGHRLPRDGRAADAPARHLDPLDRRVAADLGAEPLDVRGPGVDPDVRGRPVEHAVGPPARAREVEQQLQQDRAAGARAHLARPRRDERAREPVGEELAERRRALLGADERPPALQLPLAEAALVAAREQGQQPLDEPRRLLRRDAEAGRELEHEAGDEREVLERLRQVRGRQQLVAALALGEQHALGAHEVAVDADPPHRVRDVAVEAGEEAEAVLGRQVAAAVGPRARDGQAARLAAEAVARLVDRHREAALGQLVRGGQTRHAAAEDRDRLRHRSRQPNPYSKRVRPSRPAPRAAAARLARGGVPVLRRRGQPGGDHAAVAGLRGRHAAADRDAPGRADRVPARRCTGCRSRG